MKIALVADVHANLPALEAVLAHVDAASVDAVYHLGDLHFLNAGSVGRPKDGDPRACYAVLDVGEGPPAVEFVRVAYDVERTGRAIEESGLPDDFAAVLRTGGTL